MRVAINGFGRIGRNWVRSWLERTLSALPYPIELVAINDPGNAKVLAHLLKYDSTFGVLNNDVSIDDDTLTLGNHSIHWSSLFDRTALPWKSLDIDVVIDCSGCLSNRELAQEHIQAGAKKVLISAPMASSDITVVYGVNHQQLTDQQIISNASCTTNCLAPMAMVLDKHLGIEQGIITTIHAYTGDQQLLDASHNDALRARSAALSMIPTKTGAAEAVGLVLPALNGKLTGLSVRVPVENVSLVDLSFISKKEASIEEVNKILTQGCSELPSGIMACNQVPLVSRDFLQRAESCIVDEGQTQVRGNLIKVLAWYDNEWGFTQRLHDVCLHLANK
jgi:glyceraldehyde 3-phosphate dehydrogenase